MRPRACAPTCYATGIARGYPVLWGKNIFAPILTKTAEFEVKTKRERSKNRTFAVIIQLFLEVTKYV